jgi:hypothetical protein
MSRIRALASASRGTLSPRSAAFRVQVRLSLDLLLTLAVVVVAISLVVGYQVVRRRGASPDRTGERSERG